MLDLLCTEWKGFCKRTRTCSRTCSLTSWRYPPIPSAERLPNTGYGVSHGFGYKDKSLHSISSLLCILSTTGNSLHFFFRISCFLTWNQLQRRPPNPRALSLAQRVERYIHTWDSCVSGRHPRFLPFSMCVFCVVVCAFCISTWVGVQVVPFLLL